MRKGLVVTLSVATAAVLAFGLVPRSDAASTSSSGPGQTIPLLRVGATLSFATLDLARGYPFQFTGLGLETLMRVAPDGSLQPWLAQTVRQPNPLTYIYTLRKGIKFWNGNELTASDVANALNYHRYPGSFAGYVYGTNVRDIKARGRYTVIVTLKRRDASWQYVPASYGTAIFEKKFQDEHKTTMGQPGVLVMGTGPFRFETLDPTRGLELVANDNYWRKQKPRIRRISVKFFADENSEALAFRAGEIDLVVYVADARAFTANSGAKVSSVPWSDLTYFSMPTKTAPWSDVHVRRAVAYALNRADLIKAKGSFSVPVSTVIPPIHLRGIASRSQIKALIKSLPKYPFDLAKAREEMAKSTSPSGFSGTLVTLPAQSDSNQVIAAQLQKIGVKLDVKTVSFPEWINTVTGAGAKPPGFHLSGCPRPDPGCYPGQLLGSRKGQPSSENVASYTPPAVAALLNSGIATSNPSERLAIYTQLLRRVALDVPYVPLYTLGANYVISSKFAWPGFSGNFYDRTWALEVKPK